jgi:hypothetical protein
MQEMTDQEYYAQWVQKRKAELGQHHVWCNFFLDEPAATCSMCSGLKKNYPQDGKTEEQLQQEHFPNVKRVG